MENFCLYISKYRNLSISFLYAELLPKNHLIFYRKICEGFSQTIFYVSLLDDKNIFITLPILDTPRLNFIDFICQLNIFDIFLGILIEDKYLFFPCLIF